MQPNPLDNPTLVRAALDGVIRARAAVTGRTAADQDTSATETVALVTALAPRDAVELMLCGQIVLLNDLAALAGQDALTASKADGVRARAAAMAMTRTFGKHVDTLLRLRGLVGKPARAKKDLAAAEPVAEAPAGINATANPKPETPAPAATVPPPPGTKPAAAGGRPVDAALNLRTRPPMPVRGLRQSLLAGTCQAGSQNPATTRPRAPVQSSIAAG